MSKRSGRIAQEVAFAVETKSSSDNLSSSPAILPKRECLQFSGSMMPQARRFTAQAFILATFVKSGS